MSIALLLLIGTQQASPPSADEIMQRVRQAMNFSLEKIPEAGMILEGKSTSSGIPANTRMHFNRQGHFLQQTDSVLGTTLFGYDGKDVWSKDYDGESNILELSKRRENLLLGALYSGLWIDKSSGMAYTFAKDLALPDQYLLQFSHEPSQLTGTISIDKESLLPRKCKFTSVTGEYVIVTWKETMSYEGMKWPRYIEITIGDTKDSYQWESATAANKTDVNPFRPQISPPTNVTFDASKNALLEVKKANDGDLLVRPLVNGQDVGWFLLGIGTEGIVLHERTAKKLGLETYGDGESQTIGGKVKANWSRLKTISLGRMTLQNPLVYNVELPANLDEASGVPIAGIIGRGAFRCSAIELDSVTSQVALFDPKTYELQRGKKNWQKLYVLRGLGVEAEFEGHKGVFSLTDSPGNTVVIHSPAVKKLNLIAGRELRDTLIRGYGGNQEVKEGKLKYFEIGGHRREDVKANFATSETGAFSNPDTIGTIGGELLKPFQIVFDYQNRRIAFVKREAK
ncbi:MAG: aspartyl protease family protein [Gemmatales bacterium]